MYYADFYNKFNESLDLVNIHQLECLDNIHHSIQGIYNDELFSYYEFSVTSKTDTVEHYEKINNFLQEMDCKFQLFYTDLTIDFNDYSEPIKPYINSCGIIDAILNGDVDKAKTARFQYSI